MKLDRPVLKLPLSPLERWLEVVSILGVAFSIVMLLASWKSLPETIPSHFGLSGKADAVGNKSFLVPMPITIVCMYLLLTVVSRFPHIFNYPWPITEENAERQYRLAREVLAWIKAQDVWMLAAMDWMVIRVAQSKAESLGSSVFILLAIFVGAQTIIVSWYICRMCKAK